MKTLFGAGAIVLMLAGGAVAAPGTAVTTVNLRAGSDTSSEILAKIPGGSRVEVGDCTSGWCAVTFQGKSGFAIQTALDMSGRRVAVRGPARRGPPAAIVDDDFEPVAPAYPPGYVIAPRPYYYGPGPYWRPYWGYRRWGWRRW